jgi:hypothetical protein
MVKHIPLEGMMFVYLSQFRLVNLELVTQFLEVH